MIISNSQVSFQAARAYSLDHSRSESIRFWKTGEKPAERVNTPPSENSTTAVPLRFEFTRLQAQLSNQASTVSSRSLMEKTDSTNTKEVTESYHATGDEKLDLQISFVALLVERFTGRKLELFDPASMETDKQAKTSDKPEHPDENGQSRQSVGWGMEYEYHETFHEAETVSFSTQATVNTADGKQINVELELNMSRDFYSEEHISLRAGDALKDPLVVNYSGNAASLTDTKFSFDIDANGKMDQISFVKSGSGFLTLDKNSDARVNDGSELFGAKTGNGFNELAEYDKDGNGWIDEADPIFKQLLVWVKDASGNDQLFALADLNIGAIYLGHTRTEFSLNDKDNQQHGQVRQTGIYLKENGQAGTVQQIDLVV